MGDSPDVFPNLLTLSLLCIQLSSILHSTGKDLRTATVTAASKVEVLSLHKQNYDYFVRDIQEAEKRENFHILTDCKLFKSWPKGR